VNKTLARLLGKPEAEIAKLISKLETSCGFPSEDVRLVAENKQRIRTKIAQLQLDPDDTTDKELYHALLARFEKDAQLLDKALGVDSTTGLSDRIDKAIQLVDYAAKVDDLWVPKTSVVKSALVKFPPKHVAKLLHYRSAKSLIKRENPAEIYLAGSVIESATWLKSINGHIIRLSNSFFKLEPVKIVNLESSRWEGFSGPSSYVVIGKPVGAVAIWPSKELQNAPVLSLTLLLLEAIRSLNPAGYSEVLHKLNPALSWWADGSFLISDGAKSVSFNIKDISLNYLESRELHESVSHHGAHDLYQQLTLRYRQILNTLSDFVGYVPDSLIDDNIVKVPTTRDLAEEYVEVD
jgi:hypothetical protein